MPKKKIAPKKTTTKKKSVAKKKGGDETFDGRVWPTILEFNANLDAQLTSKSNFIFGASTVILVYVLNNIFFSEHADLDTITKIGWGVLIFGSFAASVLSIMVVLPKIRILRKKERVKKDLIYYKNIIKFHSRAEYVKKLKKLPYDNDSIGEAYANQIYSLSKNVIPFKFKTLKYSGWTLLISLFVSMVLFVIGYYTK